MSDNNNNDDDGYGGDDDDDNYDQSSTTPVDLYSILKLDRDATNDDIHRAYRLLSTTFHPDKLPSTSASSSEEIFLHFKVAHDVLIDPVLRLTYDQYGLDGVELMKRLQMQKRQYDIHKEQQQQKQQQAEENEEEDDDDDDDDDDNYEAFQLYERIEYLIQHNPIQAKEELRKFMEQHDYHEHLSEDNQVNLNLSMEFPPVLHLKSVLQDGKRYLQYTEKRVRSIPVANNEEREYIRQRFLQEQRIVDYQFNKIKDSQQAEVGFTLSSTQPRNTAATTVTGVKMIPPKWSMAMGASTNLIYPDAVSIIRTMSKHNKSKQQQQENNNDDDQRHPVSLFVNTVYQPIPASQITLTANLSNDDSHQFVLGTAHTLSNHTACRFNMTLLSKSPLKTPLLFNFKTYRHLKDIGMATCGVSMGGDGEMLQWNAKWEAHRNNVHKYTAKASVGLLQGNTLELSYRLRLGHKYHWSEEYIKLPKRVELSTSVGRFQRVSAMVTHELNTLASHPTLGFGMEHDITFGRWTWIWEFHYNGSTFKIPIPVVHFGSIGNTSAYYTRKLYHAIYYLLFQSILADIFQDHEMALTGKSKKQKDGGYYHSVSSRTNTDKFYPQMKTKLEAEKQLRLMESVADKKEFLESKRKDGLVILRATYWYKVRDDVDGSVEFITMDATKQLQFWVSNGKLVASSIPKSSWLGFYNLQTDAKSVSRSLKRWDWRIWKYWKKGLVSMTNGTGAENSSDPYLTIRYSNAGNVYEITVGEQEPFVLPRNESAVCLGNSSFVR
jgi:curved DNA-binding protein CbpA